MDEADEPRDDDRLGDRRAGPPTGDRVRVELERFADLIRDLARRDALLSAVPFLIRRLGDLRSLLFDYEVRATEHLLPVENSDEREARRIVREAEERLRAMKEEWGDHWTPDDADTGSGGEDDTSP